MRSVWVGALVMVVAALPLAAQQPCAGPGMGKAGQQDDHMAAMHKDHDAMMARMDSVDQVLTQQVAALNAAKGSARIAKLEAVVLTLATSQLAMREHMKKMMEGMDGMGGMGGMGGMNGGKGMGMSGGPPPCAQPADSAKQHQH